MIHAQVDLSVILIARNEAANIARAIESVLRATEYDSRAEIILVDSASTDETVEIARQYPINIVRLDSAWFLSAAAGRYIGMRYAKGDLIMYMDGDMELIPGWLEQAVPFMVEHPQVAGVAGNRHDIVVQPEQIRDKSDLAWQSRDAAAEVREFGGGALYRRSALEQVGGFNPFIISNEEPELCMRLRYAGYKLMHLPYPMCRNYTLQVNSWAYIIRRLRTGLWLGYGQVLRYHLRTGLLRMVILEQGSYLVYLIGVLISALSLVLTLAFGQILFFAAWMLIVGAFLLVFWIRKRSLREVWRSIALQSCVAYGVVCGFLRPPLKPQDYPTDAEIVKSVLREQSKDE